MGMIFTALRSWSIPAALLLAWMGLSASAMAELARLPITEAPASIEVIRVEPVQKPVQALPPAMSPEADEGKQLRFDQTGCRMRVCWT
jgi:hypothetical protein